MYTQPVSAQLHQIEMALNHLSTVLKEQGCQLVIDRNEGVFRVLPDSFYLDPVCEHSDDDPTIDKYNFVEIDTPIEIYDDDYHGIYDKNPEK